MSATAKSEPTAAARARLAIALDTDDLVVAERWAEQVKECFGVAKVGLELFSAAGPEAVESMREAGFEVFVDLKLYDIPTTVFRAARVLGALGARFVTLHASAGPEVLRAGVDGLSEGAAAAGLPTPRALGVTVLTSDPRHSPQLVSDRVGLALAGGCGGVVCSADDLGTVGDALPTGSELLTVVPGIRPEGSDPGDQRRVATPASALAQGAGLLVIGRPVTAAEDPAVAARGILEEAAAALGA